MRMHNPPHPGETLREDVLPALEVGVSEAADRLGVSRQTLSAVLNGRQAITPEMAVRLEAWIGAENGGRAEVWLAQQAAFDLWHVRQDKANALSGLKRHGLAAVRNRAAEPEGAEYAKAVMKRVGATGKFVTRPQGSLTAARAKSRLAARKATRKA